MRVALSYSVPIQTEENWKGFRDSVKRFTDTFRKFPPSVPCTVFAMCLSNDATTEVKQLFDGIQTEFVRYDGRGMDGGAAQYLAKIADPPHFQISMGARCYFHRSGAVKAMVDAREKHGPGLYGCTCSRQGRLHIRPSFYGMDSTDFAKYPYRIDRHEMGTQFESGNSTWFVAPLKVYSLIDWSEARGRPTYMVYWNGVFHNKDDWFNQPNTFRRGDQSNLLTWDKRTDTYAYWECPQGKIETEKAAYGIA